MPAHHNSLPGYTALITGGGTGIGLSIARHFAAAGAEKLFLVGRREEKLVTAAEELKSQFSKTMVHPIVCDVSEANERKELAEKIKSSTNYLHVLVNNAGYFVQESVASTSDSDWDQVQNVNLTAPFALIRELLPLLETAQGSIVNISSTLAVKPIPGTVAYNSAKAGLIQMTRTLALELGPLGVRVNAILPAVVETDMYRNRFPDPKEYQAVIEQMRQAHPLGRVGHPDDIGHAATFLACGQSSWITGVSLPVDGGMLCT